MNRWDWPISLPGEDEPRAYCSLTRYVHPHLLFAVFLELLSAPTDAGLVSIPAFHR